MNNSPGGGRTALRPDEALRMVIDAAPAFATETVNLGDALGRVLARDALVAIDQPPFDKSAMDGFAHASSPLAPEGHWRVLGVVAAGDGSALHVGQGECARIMTGALIPQGASAVQRVEWTETLPGAPGSPELIRFTREERADNIIRQGENQKAGDLLLSRRILGPPDIGMLASSGYSRVEVARKPRVAVLSTGDEIVSPGQVLAKGAIYDSDGPQLVAQASACGCDARFMGIVRDDEDALARAFSEALASCDVLIVSGGVSLGAFDHVPAALARAGVEKIFHGLAMKPGKPLFFGRTQQGTTAFGLPGNPVSTFVGFEVLCRPHLAARTGLDWKPRFLGARLAASLSRRETDRAEFVPARLESGADGLPAVRPLAYKGSSMLAALAQTDCLIFMDIGVDRLPEGSVVDARLVRA